MSYARVFFLYIVVVVVIVMIMLVVGGFFSEPLVMVMLVVVVVVVVVAVGFYLKTMYIRRSSQKSTGVWYDMKAPRERQNQLVSYSSSMKTRGNNENNSPMSPPRW